MILDRAPYLLWTASRNSYATCRNLSFFQWPSTIWNKKNMQPKTIWQLFFCKIYLLYILLKPMVNAAVEHLSIWNITIFRRPYSAACQKCAALSEKTVNQCFELLGVSQYAISRWNLVVCESWEPDAKILLWCGSKQCNCSSRLLTFCW